MIKNYYPTCTSRFLNDLNTLGVIFLLYLSSICERFMLCRSIYELESSSVKRYSVFFAANILNLYCLVLKIVVTVAFSSGWINICYRGQWLDPSSGGTK